MQVATLLMKTWLVLRQVLSVAKQPPRSAELIHPLRQAENDVPGKDWRLKRVSAKSDGLSPRESWNPV